eukprot:855369-Lingulodinium_polyedra.AAC.1
MASSSAFAASFALASASAQPHENGGPNSMAMRFARNAGCSKFAHVGIAASSSFASASSSFASGPSSSNAQGCELEAEESSADALDWLFDALDWLRNACNCASSSAFSPPASDAS